MIYQVWTSFWNTCRPWQRRLADVGFAWATELLIVGMK